MGPQPSEQPHFDWIKGGSYGLLSSVGYTVANVCLREVSHMNPVWVALVKALPTIALTLPWLIFVVSSGRAKLPGKRAMAMLIGGGIAGQIGGNICFQWSLHVIGLALAVPLTTGSLIIAGATLARVLLGEKISKRNLSANGIMVLAVCILSLGAPSASKAIGFTGDEGTGWTWAFLGVVAACIPGLGYSLQNIAIRRALTQGTHIAAALLTVSTTATIVTILWLEATVSVSKVAQATSSAELNWLLAAGVCNAAAFVALSIALRLTPIWFVYALTSTQVAMAAVCGVWLFNEPATPTLVAGSLLTIVGLAMMRPVNRSKVRAEKHSEEPS
jgi:DME family drug/metabolite transporter